MTAPLPFELDDVLIERMLAGRAGTTAPIGLLRDVMADVGTRRQARRSWVPVASARPRDVRMLLIVAGLIALLAAGGVLIAGGLPKLILNVAPPAATVAPTPPGVVASTEPTALPLAAGQPIAVLEITGGTTRVYTIDVATGAQGPIGQLQQLSGSSGEHLQVANDRQHAIVFRDSDAVLAQVDLSTGSVRPLTSIPLTGNRANVSPDGTRIARFDDSGNIEVLDLDGNKVAQVRMPAHLQPSLGLAWSPDGANALATGCLAPSGECATNAYDLYLVPLDGSSTSVRSLARGGAAYGVMSWSPDGGTIAATGPGDSGIWTLRRSDGLVANLTAATVDTFPVFSPDGSRIAFWRSGALEVINVDGTSLVRVTQHDGARGAPVWSPDGQWLLFNTVAEAGLGDVWLVPAAGGEPRLVVHSAIADW